MFLILSIFFTKILIIISSYGFLKTILESPRHKKLVHMTWDLISELRYGIDVRLRKFWETWYAMTDKNVNSINYFQC